MIDLSFSLTPAVVGFILDAKLLKNESSVSMSYILLDAS